MLDRRLRRCLIAQLRQQRGALARTPPEYRIDQAVTATRASLCQLHPVRDDRVVGRAVQVQQLIQTEPQRRQEPRIQSLRGAIGETLDQIVERALALHGSVEQAHRQRPIARVEPLRLALQCAVGVGAVLEHPSQDDICADARLSGHAHADMRQRPSGDRRAVALRAAPKRHHRPRTTVAPRPP